MTTALKFQNCILNCLHYFWLISCSGNAVPEGFENEETLDVSLRAEQSTLEDYDNIPVEKVKIIYYVALSAAWLLSRYLNLTILSLLNSGVTLMAV